MSRFRSTNPIKLTCAALLLTMLMACGSFVTTFRVGLVASKPFVQSLVTSGVISQSKADIVTGDIGEGVNGAIECQACLNAITVTGPAKRVGKAKCYKVLAGQLRTVLKRNNIGGNPQLDNIAVIVQGAIDALEEYYRQVNGGPVAGETTRASKSASPSPVVASDEHGTRASDPDKVLEQKLSAVRKQLKAATRIP